ncbi:MAG: hypothetical protein OXC95_08970 [Dehalococcoidia bacterium]|nr:hypothetical protein [Dehalococcoidia bacterium]
MTRRLSYYRFIAYRNETATALNPAAEGRYTVSVVEDTCDFALLMALNTSAGRTVGTNTRMVVISAGIR